MLTETDKLAFRKLINEVWNNGKYDLLKEYFHPVIKEHQFGLHPTIDGMREDIEFLRTAFPDFNLTIEDLVVDKDKLWVRMTARGTNLGGFMGPPNGKPFEITVFDTCRYEDGKIIEHWGSPDRFALMSQLGLLPIRQPQMV
jgi:predicted ester cyclase